MIPSIGCLCVWQGARERKSVNDARYLSHQLHYMAAPEIGPQPTQHGQKYDFIFFPMCYTPAPPSGYRQGLCAWQRRERRGDGAPFDSLLKYTSWLTIPLLSFSSPPLSNETRPCQCWLYPYAVPRPGCKINTEGCRIHSSDSRGHTQREVRFHASCL